MTETSANTELRNKVHWGTFLGALVAAPILTLLAGALFTSMQNEYLYVVGLVLVFAPAFGLPTYLLVVAPFLALFIQRFGAHPLALVLVGLIANLASAPLVLAWAYLSGNADFDVIAFVGLGCFVSLVWTGVFGLLYRSGCRD